MVTVKFAGFIVRPDALSCASATGSQLGFLVQAALCSAIQFRFPFAVASQLKSSEPREIKSTTGKANAISRRIDPFWLLCWTSSCGLIKFSCASPFGSTTTTEFRVGWETWTSPLSKIMIVVPSGACAVTAPVSLVLVVSILFSGGDAKIVEG